MSEVIVYTTDRCNLCLVAKKLLEDKGIRFKEVNLSKNPVGRQSLVDKTGNYSFPQIMIDNQAIGGLKELVELDRSGKLEQLLESK